MDTRLVYVALSDLQTLLVQEAQIVTLRPCLADRAKVILDSYVKTICKLFAEQVD